MAYQLLLRPDFVGGVEFITQDGKVHSIDGAWDIVIAHPPCTYLTVSGNAWFNENKWNTKARQRYMDRAEAIRFFLQFATCNAKMLAIENPVGIMSNVYRKPDQIIQPWMFGHNASKKTCLWLRGLKPLEPTKIIEPDENGRYANQTPDGQNKLMYNGKWIGFNDPLTAKLRSKTYKGIAYAMAHQWGGYAT